MTTSVTDGIVRLEEDDLIIVMRALAERLTALGYVEVANYCTNAASDLRYFVDRQTEADRESEEFNRTWASAASAQRSGMEWGLLDAYEQTDRTDCLLRK